VSAPIYHLLPYATWQTIPAGGSYAPESLASEGFVHFSGDEATLLAVANAFYREATGPMVVLAVDPSRLTAEVRWEPAEDGRLASAQFPHVYGPVEHSAVIAVRHVRRAPDGRYLAVVDRPATAEALDLVPHPEGGWYRQTWAAPTRFTPSGYGGERAAATAILFLLRPDEESAWHRVRSDELWFWHAGGPLGLGLGGTGDAPGAPHVTVLGGDLSAGQRPQALVPGDTWQSARPASGKEVLVSCVVAPGFDFADFTLDPS
jgi:hypothetical protein